MTPHTSGPHSSRSADAALTRRRLLTAGLTAGGLFALDRGLHVAPAADRDKRPSTGRSERMTILRTPDDRFTGLDGYPFAPHYVEVDAGDAAHTALRVHYLDEQPADPARASAETILLLHGEPSWSYLYRHMIPPLVAAGHRCVVPDLVGFGRSDKPASRADYTYQRHVDWLRETIFDRLDLRDLTLVCHDWGGLLGLRLLAEHPSRFRRAVASNTFLPTGDQDPGEAFRTWRTFSQQVEDFDVGGIVTAGTAMELSPAAKAGYDAPFPDESYKAGARQFPLLVPITADDPASEPNRRAWAALETLRAPFLCAFSDLDWASRGDGSHLCGRIPGAEGQAHTTIRGGGHFLQEDRGSELAAVVDAFIRSTG